MAFQSFVSESFLKEFTPLNVNIDITELTPHLQSTELVWTRELLGRPLYDDLKLNEIKDKLLKSIDFYIGQKREEKYLTDKLNEVKTRLLNDAGKVDDSIVAEYMLYIKLIDELIGGENV